MILAVKWAREQKRPFLGICLGFQCAVIEWARNVLGMPRKSSYAFVRRPYSIPWTGANSGEFVKDADPAVVIFMPEVSKTHMGGTMRLGLRPTVFEEGTETWSKVRKLYGGAGKIWERHRHRYEVNPEYADKFQQSGLSFTGKDEKGERMQFFELRGIAVRLSFVEVCSPVRSQITRTLSDCSPTPSSARGR